MNGGPNEYVRHEVDGLKIHANPDSIAWGLGTLFSDWEKARAMGRAGREAVAESFTWEVIAGQTLDVYASLPALAPAQPKQAVVVPSEPVEETVAAPKETERAQPVWSPVKPGTVAVKRARSRRRSRSGPTLAGRV
jgi:hypothetical protein